MLASGSRLGAYEILAPLDAGGMGEVYRARDTRLPREVAVKVLPADRVTDPQARQRFEREAAAIAQLSHPRICTLHDRGVDGDRLYLVMELLTGQTLAARLERHRGAPGLPLREALAVAAEVAEALAFAHRHHVVHRDVKPANIMLTESGTKLLDFGVAHLQGDAAAGVATASSLTAPYAVVGTLPYMSPEQLDGKADERSDLFALGAVLYEMLTGRRAFPGDTTSTVVAALVKCEPEPIAALLADVPASVERIVRRCLQRDPERRWQSAVDLADELRWALETPGLTGVTADRSKTGAATPGDRQRWRAGVAAGVTALMLVVGAGGFLGGQWSSLGGDSQEPYVDDLPLPADTRFWGGQIAWSPAGDRVAIITQSAEPGGVADPRL